MKLNSVPKNYIPLSQSQSDDELGPSANEQRNQTAHKISLYGANDLQKDDKQVECISDPKSTHMSPIRKLCFIISLVVCILFVVIFVFVAPCSEVNRLHGLCYLTRRWKSDQHNLSYVSPLDFVHSKNFGSYIVILGYSHEESGLIAIEGSTGKECWRLTLLSVPTSSLCNAIDGSPECIIIRKNGLLTAVDLKKGACLWLLHNHSDLCAVTSLEEPLFMPDCDNDNIPDLFVPHINNGKNIMQLAVVSGGTGQIIGSLLELRQCSKPVSSQFVWKNQNESAFFLYCAGKDSEF